MWPLKKKLTASVLFALAASAPHERGVARACEGLQCPRVVVRCAEQGGNGQPLTYTVSVEGPGGNASPTYKWTTSAGVISSGEGTSSVVVDTTGLFNERVEATVEVGGLPEGCPHTASCATHIPAGCGLTQPFDEYGGISIGDEKARLDGFAVAVQNTPESRGYIFAYGGRVGRAGAARRRAERAREYLVNTRGIDASRVVIVDGGYREELTIQFYLMPPEAGPPEASPSVDPSEVKFVQEPKARGPRRREARRARHSKP